MRCGELLQAREISGFPTDNNAASKTLRLEALRRAAMLPGQRQ
jgi:hypothetical protein